MREVVWAKNDGREIFDSDIRINERRGSCFTAGFTYYIFDYGV